MSCNEHVSIRRDVAATKRSEMPGRRPVFIFIFISVFIPSATSGPRRIACRAGLVHGYSIRDVTGHNDGRGTGFYTVDYVPCCQPRVYVNGTHSDPRSRTEGCLQAQGTPPVVQGRQVGLAEIQV